MYFFLLFRYYLPKGPRTHICKNKIYLPKNTLFWLELVSWVEIDALVLILQKIFKCLHCSIFQFLLLSPLLAGNNRLNLNPVYPRWFVVIRRKCFQIFIQISDSSISIVIIDWTYTCMFETCLEFLKSQTTL